MTPEIEKKRRELFEQIMSKKYSAAIGWHERDENGYMMATIRDQWTGFNAALDAVEIELPEEFDKRDVQGLDYDEVVAAITATGLGLRIK